VLFWRTTLVPNAGLGWLFAFFVTKKNAENLG
jgi:hypothetical protein